MNTTASQIRGLLGLSGYAVADVGEKENFLGICRQLGKITQTREIFLKPKNMVEKYTGYSHLSDEVPFHTDYPLVNSVGMFCEIADNLGGENLLIDTREILDELSPLEIEGLKSIQIPLPHSESRFPVLTMEQDSPHIYWLPAFTLTNLEELEDYQVVAIRRVEEILSIRRRERRYLTFKLKPGEALWFNNFVMLHARDQLNPSSQRKLVRTFMQYR